MFIVWFWGITMAWFHLNICRGLRSTLKLSGTLVFIHLVWRANFSFTLTSTHVLSAKKWLGLPSIYQTEIWEWLEFQIFESSFILLMWRTVASTFQTYIVYKFWSRSTLINNPLLWFSRSNRRTLWWYIRRRWGGNVNEHWCVWESTMVRFVHFLSNRVSKIIFTRFT